MIRWPPASSATTLPDGVYRFANPPPDAELAALGFLLALYRYSRFKADNAPKPKLVAPDGVDARRIERVAAAIAYGRDLVNSPANALGPHALEQEAVKLAEGLGATISMIRGDDLLAANFPLIHAVGRAAAERPRIVDFAWGRLGAPKVTLIGKGVTFDTGGLDIKPASGMELMKKDMGGAATALALAKLVMESGLDLRLRVVVPIVENAISAAAMRPGDVIVSRKGLAVEIGNTDAEGRLILADALALADEDAPDLMFDFATLTGRRGWRSGPTCRPSIPTTTRSRPPSPTMPGGCAIPLWRLPLWRPYEAMIEGTVGDVSNSGTGAGMAGSITAALFLRRFVERTKAWAHFDVYAWNPKPRAHGPAGGEIQAARALFDLLERALPEALTGGHRSLDLFVRGSEAAQIMVNLGLDTLGFPWNSFVRIEPFQWLIAESPHEMLSWPLAAARRRARIRSRSPIRNASTERRARHGSSPYPQEKQHSIDFRKTERISPENSASQARRGRRDWHAGRYSARRE